MKKWLKHKLPTTEKLSQYKSLGIFGTYLHNPALWHLHRRSVSKAAAIGLFVMYLPIPLQMVVAAALAIWWRANLPVAVVLVWITNPLTMGPMFYFAYLLGALLFPQFSLQTEIKFNVDFLSHHWQQLWVPMLLGSLICAMILALCGYYGVRLAWRCYLNKAWQKRGHN